MDKKFEEEFDILLSNYSDLLVGQDSENLKLKRMVEIWMLYSSMSKNMPGLVRHWNEQFPESKKTLIHLVTEIKKRNEIQKQNQN
ncbi:DUF2573 family protein [Bacillus sp. B1-b2]|uniref:DUF2573 family protein n=1 Tax=Bacillus sp. B1-b2 TaxID=2653201 RepID=UPI00126156D1|nr:DUF2573 family protein [Bacillus sp. B1-b2]KAB7666516.1 DUF2573 family protein [Bacillus sp. B1-b2]